jgi:hypothetical protein
MSLQSTESWEEGIEPGYLMLLGFFEQRQMNHDPGLNLPGLL